LAGGHEPAGGGLRGPAGRELGGRGTGTADPGGTDGLPAGGPLGEGGPAGSFPGAGRPGAGRPGAGRPGAGAGALPGRADVTQPGSAEGGPGGGTGSTSLTSAERQLFDYVSAREDGAKYLLAVQSWTEASPFIVATGREVMPIGGFSGSVPSPPLARFRELIRTGQLRFVLLDEAAGNLASGSNTSGGTQASLIASWVERTCTKVPAKDYGSTSGARATRGGTTGTLYACSRA
jgi:hypothetical protein